MENKVSPYEERQLTNAIERAATVASVNESLDRNQLLVDQLKKASVDPKFAKTASQAFNKRLTVLTFKKTADEHKADTFELSDPELVYKMMTNDAETKVAAVNFAITTEQLEELEEESMDKAASCDLGNVVIKDKRYECLCSWDTFKQHLESEMDKIASGFRDLQSDLMRRENKLEEDAQDVASYFKKANYDFDFTTAVNLYGDKLEQAIGSLVDKGVSFKKTAKYVIAPSKEIFKKVAKLIQDKEAYEDLRWLAGELVEGMSEFAKSAAALGDEYQIKEADLNSEIAAAKDDVDKLTGEIKALKDQLNADATSGVLGQRLGGLANIGIGTAAGLGEGAVGAVNDITGAARTALNNAKALYYAGNNVSISPGDLLDAAFLTKDRYRDRLLAWSDMSADPQLAMYPAEQVFAATQKAMDMDTSMERPDQREVLRAQVAQLLAQNNRVSTADIAALATTLKALGASRPNAAGEAAAAVSALGDKSEPGLVAQDAIVGQFGDTQGLKDMRADAIEGYKDNLKQLEAIGDREREIDKDNLKDVTSQRDAIEKTLQQMLKTKEQREFDAQQKLDAANAKQVEYDKKDNILKSLGYEKRITPSGAAHYVYTGKGAPHIDNGWAKDRGDLTDSEATRVADAIRANR